MKISATASNEAVEPDRTDHALCALTGALSLIAGRRIRTPKHAYPYTSPSKLARLLQVGNGARELLLSTGRKRVLVSGEYLAYRDGQIEYFTDHIFGRWWRAANVKQPCFVLAGEFPAGKSRCCHGLRPGARARLCVANHHCGVLITANWQGTPAILPNFAPCESGIARLRRQVSGLGIGSSVPQIRHLLPRVLVHTDIDDGAAVLALTKIAADRPEFSWRRVDAATELWLSRKPTSENTGKPWVRQRTAQVCEFYSRFRELLLPVASALSGWCESARIPGGVTHGDLWYGNVLYRGDTVAGIVDWEFAQPDGFLEVDGLHMMLGSIVARLRRVSRTIFANSGRTRLRIPIFLAGSPDCAPSQGWTRTA